MIKRSAREQSELTTTELQKRLEAWRNSGGNGYMKYIIPIFLLSCTSVNHVGRGMSPEGNIMFNCKISGKIVAWCSNRNDCERICSE